MCTIERYLIKFTKFLLFWNQTLFRLAYTSKKRNILAPDKRNIENSLLLYTQIEEKRKSFNARVCPCVFLPRGNAGRHPVVCLARPTTDHPSCRTPRSKILLGKHSFKLVTDTFRLPPLRMYFWQEQLASLFIVFKYIYRKVFILLGYQWIVWKIWIDTKFLSV